MKEENEQGIEIVSENVPIPVNSYHPGYVYCLLDNIRHPKLMKIGHTKNVANRINQINSGMPIKMHLWWNFEGSHEDEMSFHWMMRRFKHPVGHQREWYTATRECLNKAYFHHPGPMSEGYCEKVKWLKQRKVLAYLSKKRKINGSYEWLNSYFQRNDIQYLAMIISERFERAMSEAPEITELLNFDDYTLNFIHGVAFPKKHMPLTDKQLIGIMKLSRKFSKDYFRTGPLQTLQLFIRGDYYKLLSVLTKIKYRYIGSIIK